MADEFKKLDSSNIDNLLSYIVELPAFVDKPTIKIYNKDYDLSRLVKSIHKRQAELKYEKEYLGVKISNYFNLNLNNVFNLIKIKKNKKNFKLSTSFKRYEKALCKNIEDDTEEKIME